MTSQCYSVVYLSSQSGEVSLAGPFPCLFEWSLLFCWYRINSAPHLFSTDQSESICLALIVYTPTCSLSVICGRSQWICCYPNVMSCFFTSQFSLAVAHPRALVQPSSLRLLLTDALFFRNPLSVPQLLPTSPTRSASRHQSHRV